MNKALTLVVLAAASVTIFGRPGLNPQEHPKPMPCTSVVSGMS